ncbi:transcriptional regulator, HxlR family [Lentzea albidocapillata subsp. violacea]|uniref:Transcriptional regulator, HxlR family n=1 Tax=Lentzea albidocapillata subsp. violacea TaxID=128104 RepID=A0A1G8TTM1_9PSEU|nr:winged helix-turn-helix transcriptional regulator [Lentzea albidocapillata]SDJ44823.1 transcriptional regulator, HxlR family [Lentzea albidocapillata subsp. violacea]
MASAKRDYGQFCGLAAALNVIGERWTLLVVRELLIGPARFTELAGNLPGAGPNLLSDRLRMLVEHGVVEQSSVAGDGRARQYHLTDLGEELRGPVLALANWGLGFLREEDRSGAVRAEWGFLAVQSMVVESAIPDVDEVYEFQVGDEPFVIEVRDGAVAFGRGHAERPDLTIECDADTFVRVGARMLSPFEAIATGDVRIKGKAESVRRCILMLGLN